MQSHAPLRTRPVAFWLQSRRPLGGVAEFGSLGTYQMHSLLGIVLVLAIALFSGCASHSPAVVECELCRAFSPLVWMPAVFQGLRGVPLSPGYNISDLWP